MLTEDTRFGIRSDEIAYKVLDGETIIINVVNGLYYSLPGVGSEAWEMIEEGRSLGEIATILSARYGVSPEVVAADVGRLAAELVAENLVAATGAGVARPLPATERAEGAYQPPALQTYRDMADLLALDPPMPGIIFPPAPVAPPRPGD